MSIVDELGIPIKFIGVGEKVPRVTDWTHPVLCDASNETDTPCWPRACSPLLVRMRLLTPSHSRGYARLHACACCQCVTQSAVVRQVSDLMLFDAEEYVEALFPGD